MVRRRGHSEIPLGNRVEHLPDVRVPSADDPLHRALKRQGPTVCSCDNTVAEARACEACGSRSFAAIFEKDGHHFYRCDGCGLERIDPQPTDETLSRIYGRQYYDAWGLGHDPDAVREMKKATFRRTIAGVPSLRPGARVLDCGAATGFLMDVAREMGLDAYGVELSEYGAGAIAERFGADHVFQGQVEDASFPGAPHGSFSAIFMCDFLEHVRDPVAVLGAAHRFLEPGGTIAICAPKVHSLTHRLMRESWTHYKVEHIYYFTTQSLRRLLARTGFENYRERPPWKSMSLDYVRRQFETFPHPLMGATVRAITAAIPAAVQQARFPILMGEVLAYAQKG